VLGNSESFLNSLPGDLNIDASLDTLEKAGSDVFFTGDHSPFVVLYPDSVNQVESIWTSASDYGVPIVNRGAGLSYTAGALPHSSNTALLDLSKLTRISPPNLTDRVITVEAGVRWQMIDELLANGCYRLAMPTPISGSRSTVGGAIAQGLPVGLESVVGLEVVIPGGELLKIGACHWGEKQRGCHRMMGADLIGLFMGSGGILGTIVSAHLRLESQPKIVSHRSYSTRNLAHSAEVITRLSATEADPLLIALPVRRERDIAKIGVRDKIKLAWNALRSCNTNLARLKLLFQLSQLSFTPHDDEEMACVHVTVEATSKNESSRVMAELDALAVLHDAIPVSSAVPAIFYSRPYSLRGMLGPKGERWVPVHGISAISGLSELALCASEFIDKQGENAAAMGISITWMIMSWPGKCALIEPMFLWSAPLLPVHSLAGDIAKRVVIEPSKEASQRTDRVIQLREMLIQQLDECGALHLQLGKSYAYRERLSRTADQILSAIKKEVDPKLLCSPGNLGF
jgi:hypothetical protein